MAGISSLGVGSGVLNSDLVDSLVSAERKPAEMRLSFDTERADAKLSAYGKLRSAITELRLPMRQLSSPDAMRSFAASSSNSDIGVTLNSAAASRGTYSVNVSQMATSHSIASAEPGFADKDATRVGTGSLTISTGDTTKTLNIDDSNNTLQGIAKSLNELNMGVSASVIDTGSGFRLVMTAENSGAANELRISAADEAGNAITDGTGLSQFSFGGAEAGETIAGGMAQTVAAQDAMMTVNGIEIVRPTNTIEGVVDGLTFDITGTGTSTVKVSQDTAAVVDKVQAFIDKFNALQDTIKELAGYNAETQQGGLLNGDSTVRNIQTQLRSTLSQVVPGLENASVRSMADVGIATDWQTGKLTLDRAKFTTQLENNPNDMTALFSEQGRASDSQVEFVRSSSTTQAGSYAIRVDQMATQGSYSAATAPSLDFSQAGANTSFSLKVDGETTADISLAAKTYASQEELLDEINAQLQSNPALSAAAKSVSASFDAGGNLVFTSGKFGASSNVSVTTGNVELGLDTATGTSVAGLDVVGTINGKAAKGDGQVLYTGTENTGPESGLQVRITGGTTGDRGTLTFIEGVGESVVNLVSGFLDAEGALFSRTDSLSRELEDIAEKQTQLEARMESYRERLVKQFSAADSLISQLNNTRDFVTQQLEALAPQNQNN